MIIKNDSFSIDLTFPQIMGILNVTPDSFSDGGKYQTRDLALKHVEKMIQDGATFIDVGGESTRPGANFVSEQEELDRVIPIIEMISKYFEVWISVDTSKPKVMLESAKAGAHLINDIRALNEPHAIETIAKIDLPVCIMHMQGSPQTMQKNPDYKNVVDEVYDFFVKKIALCESHGIKKNCLILDPGFGFGKTVQHNYQLLANLKKFQSLDLPILVGLSRKEMIGKVLNVPPLQRISGSLSGAVIAVMNGAKIVRVHDVKETVDAIRIVQATISEGGKIYEST